MLLKYGDKYLTTNRLYSYLCELELTDDKQDIWEVEYIDDSHTHGLIYTTSPSGDVRWLYDDSCRSRSLYYIPTDKCTAVKYGERYYCYDLWPYKSRATTYNIANLYNGYSPMQSKELRDLYGGQLDNTKLLYLEYDSDDYVLK
jgi:hypothetical protein